MASDSIMGRVLAAVGVGGLLLTSLTAGGPPVWVWISLIGAGLAHSLAWRAAGVRRVSARERSKHALQLRNAARRERKHLKATLRIGRRMKAVLAEVREHPGMEWAHTIAATVRELQAARVRHESVLVHHKMLADKTASDLSGLVSDRLTDSEE